MPIVRYTAKQVRRMGRVNKKIIDATTEADIARHAAEDDSSTDHLDLMEEYRAGGLKSAKIANCPTSLTLRANWQQKRLL